MIFPVAFLTRPFHDTEILVCSFNELVHPFILAGKDEADSVRHFSLLLGVVAHAGLGLPREAPTRLIQPRITNASISSLYSPSGISWQRSKRISCTFCSRTVGVVGAGRDGPFPVSSARRCCMATTCAYIDARSSSFARGCWAKRSLNSRLRRCAASRHTRLYSSRRLVAAAAS